MSTPPRLSLTHLKAVSISESLVTSHLRAYSLPVADCKDLDSSWDTVSIASVSMNMFHYIASCSLMQGYQHFTCWTFLHRMSHFTMSWQAIISLHPMTHQGPCTGLHVFIFRKRAVILVFALRTVSHPLMVRLASHNYVEPIQYFTPSCECEIWGLHSGWYPDHDRLPQWPR